MPDSGLGRIVSKQRCKETQMNIQSPNEGFQGLRSIWVDIDALQSCGERF